METTPIQRFRMWFKSSKYRQRDIVNALNVEKQLVSKWVNSAKDIKLETLQQLKSHFPELDIHWIITGESSMYETISDIAKLEEPAKDYGKVRKVVIKTGVIDWLRDAKDKTSIAEAYAHKAHTLIKDILKEIEKGTYNDDS